LTVTIPPNPRAIALYVAAHNTQLQDRLAFAEAILPLVELYAAHLGMVVYVDQMIPNGRPAGQWIALAADHLAFLCPEVETLAGRAEAEIAVARGERA
jgi:hypothetical protein